MNTITASADALIPDSHPFRRHLHRVTALETAEPHRAWTPADGPFPALYISHGAPPTFEDGPWMRQLHDWARALPRPKELFVTLGAATDPTAPVTTAIDGYMMGLAKRSFQAA